MHVGTVEIAPSEPLSHMDRQHRATAKALATRLIGKWNRCEAQGCPHRPAPGKGTLCRAAVPAKVLLH